MVCNLGVDHLGTPMRAWDNTASFVWAADTNGMRQRRSHKTLQGAAEHQPIARGCPQHGHRKDNWNRYYDPNTGRYLTPDPLAVRIPTHRDPIYSYAFSNPMRFTDPFGLYGTNDCSYYAERCAESGGAYYLLLRTGPVLV